MHQLLIFSSTSVNTAGRVTPITGIADQLVSGPYLAGDGSRYRHSMLRRLQRVPVYTSMVSKSFVHDKRTSWLLLVTFVLAVSDSVNFLD
jgi:hypothetical protein